MRSQRTKLRIVVSGLAATYPLGGVFWDYFQYCQGLTDLGHDVLYLEDTGGWCYDPESARLKESGEESASWLRQQVVQSLPAQRENWTFRDARGVQFGADTAYASDFCETADLFLNVSGATVWRTAGSPTASTVYIDSDPMYSQVYVSDAMAGELDSLGRGRLDVMRSYDRMFTYGENIGDPDCLVPSEMFDWRPTRQPILVDRMKRHRVPFRLRERKLRTVGSWEPYKEPIVVNGQQYFGKPWEFFRFRGLAERSPIQLELALSGEVPFDQFTSSGWSFTDAAPINCSTEGYLHFLASSFAEWSVAKHAYVASRSGWFSGRTAVYLALGVPAIVQDTGFSRFLPTGEGLFAFSTPDEALAAIEEVAANYEHHCEAALEIAHEHFDAKRVLSRLIDQVFSNSSLPVLPRNPVRAS